ncbi:two-component system capsular synthesis response regulator RcsB [Burkholderia pyrrocinia]|uniref:Two-component system capsular synthesis response regulator RcsB n=3 Tax=Burkholderia TaxID=32008 RepID=A0A318HUF2_BURPY|nr:two-component system capsular synthesis response regulator RcsB [Burkholderia pyrrocinia]
MDQFAIRVMLADDHPAIVCGLLHTLKKHHTVKVVGRAAHSTELMAQLCAHRCDVLVCDYAMPGGDHGDGIPLFALLRRRYPETRIVVHTMHDNAGVIRALLKLGIACMLSKADATEHLLAAIHGAYANGRYFSPTIARVVRQFDLDLPGAGARELTQRESEVVRLFASGMTVDEIAAHLKRSKQTIRSQKINALRKLGLERHASRAGDSLWADAFASPDQSLR